MGTAVQVAPRDKILTTVERYSDEIAKLAPKGVDPAHYMASLRLYLSRNSKLLDCTPSSIAQGILRVAQTGLELGVSCDLLPFKTECQFNPRYNGIIELALGSGTRSVNADVVREGDFFEWEKGTQFKLRHRKDAPSSAKITHAYAIAEIKQGSFVFEVLDKAEIDKIRTEFSKQWKGGTLEQIPWYAKKRAVRQLAPYLPKNARFAAALMYADDADAIPEGQFEIPGEADVLRHRLCRPVPAFGRLRRSRPQRRRRVSGRQGLGRLNGAEERQ